MKAKQLIVVILKKRKKRQCLEVGNEPEHAMGEIKKSKKKKQKVVKNDNLALVN